MKQDSNIIQKPKCSCGQDGIIYFGDVLVCGDCAMKLVKKRNLMIANELKEVQQCQE